MAGEWKDTTLGECADWLSGGTPFKGNNAFWSGSIPWVSAKDLKSFRLHDAEDHISDSAVGNGGKLVPSGTILLLVRGMTLHNDVPICMTTREMAFNQDIKALRPAKNVDGAFLAYWLLAHKPDLLASVDSAGHGTGRLVTDTLKERGVRLPPLAEQKAIAAVLGALDDKIELNRRMNATLEAMARALFQSWFVDFDPVRAKLDGRKPDGLDKATAALFPSAFQDSPLGPIPRGWTVDTIKNRASTIQYGFTQSATDEPIGPRFLRITDIRGGTIDWSSVPFCQATEEEQEKYRIADGDIFIARTGASTGDNIYVIEPPAAVFASYLVRVQFASPGVGRLVGEFTRTPDYANHVAGSIGGSAQPNASAQTLVAASLVFPTEDLADAFYRNVGPLDSRRAANDRQSRTLATLRDTLLPKLLSGELAVPPALGKVKS